MATRPDRLFGLLALLAIIAAFVLTVAAALVAIFVFYLDLTIFFVSLLVVSALLFIPALVCHSVFLCCRPTRCPAIAAAVLSGLFSTTLFICCGMVGADWSTYYDDDYWYPSEYYDYTYGRGRTIAMFSVSGVFALLACIFQIVATCKMQPEINMSVINVPGVTGNSTTVVNSSSSMMGGGYPMQQGGGYPMQQGGYPMQQGGYSMQPMQQSGGYPMQQQQQQGGGYPMQQQGGYPMQQQGGYPMQQQQPSQDGYASDGSVGSQPSFATQQPPQQPVQQLEQDVWAERTESLA